ncbi:MAG TPA: hypothetical protein DCR93_21990 [Cytophagales bacterium]|nr:hypothetical protein [Cytophagales bacterium]HAP62052.1 hypothetical protein [Cytophagales bacterium]
MQTTPNNTNTSDKAFGVRVRKVFRERYPGLMSKVAGILDIQPYEISRNIDRQDAPTLRALQAAIQYRDSYTQKIKEAYATIPNEESAAFEFTAITPESHATKAA